ncbi:hypothetical protein ACWGJT_11045 [Streptomyces xantholiticus]
MTQRRPYSGAAAPGPRRTAGGPLLPTETSACPLALDSKPCIHPAVATVLGLTVLREKASGAQLAGLVTAAVAIVLLALG